MHKTQYIEIEQIVKHVMQKTNNFSVNAKIYMLKKIIDGIQECMTLVEKDCFESSLKLIEYRLRTYEVK